MHTHFNNSVTKTEGLNLQQIVALTAAKTGYQPRTTQTGYIARCPAHNDKNPSLSISEGTDSRVLLHCHAGCNNVDVCNSLGISFAALYQKTAEPTTTYNHKAKKMATYSYRNKDGKLVCWKIRFEPGFENSSKSFMWQRYGTNGEKINNRSGCEKLLYKLPEILSAIALNKPIYLVEGEKDADNLFKLGLVATTAQESTEWNDEFTNMLKDTEVILLYDNDKAGHRRRDLIIRYLHGKTKSLKVIDLPGIQYTESHGKDITDWLSMGNTIEQLQDLIQNTPEYASTITKNLGSLRMVTLHELLNMDIPTREMILEPFLPKQGLVLMYSKRGLGKTHVALGIAYAVATGGSFLRWTATKPRKVIYLDGEMTADEVKKRLQGVDSAENIQKHDPDYLHIITPDLQDKAMPNLSTNEGKAAIEPYIADRDLIIVDNISCLFRGLVENDAESWTPVQEWALDIKRRGKSIIFIHHAGKSGTQRGTSKKEDAVDVTIKLEQPSDYKINEGAKFDVIFEKTRHFIGKEAEPFQAHLIEENGVKVWKISSTDHIEVTKLIAQMRKEKQTIEKIMEETKLTKSQVETQIKKAREIGLLS